MSLLKYGQWLAIMEAHFPALTVQLPARHMRRIYLWGAILFSFILKELQMCQNNYYARGVIAVGAFGR